jgi:hypothetical protein
VRSGEPRAAIVRVLTFAGAGVGAGIASFVLTARNPIVQHPFHHDDFDHLAMTVREFGLPVARPLSRLALVALADVSPHVLYAALLALVVLYPMLCVLFVRRLLGMELSPIGAAASCAAVAFANIHSEHAPETFRDTGHMTNAV